MPSPRTKAYHHPLIKWFEQRNLSVAQVAKAVGLSARPLYWALMNGRPLRMDYAKALATYFNVSIEDLPSEKETIDE